MRLNVSCCARVSVADVVVLGTSYVYQGRHSPESYIVQLVDVVSLFLVSTSINHNDKGEHLSRNTNDPKMVPVGCCDTLFSRSKWVIV